MASAQWYARSHTVEPSWTSATPKHLEDSWAGAGKRQYYMCIDCAQAKAVWLSQTHDIFSPIDWENDDLIHVGDEMPNQATAREANLAVANAIEVRAQSTDHKFPYSSM